jgi:hypothetical protein
VAGYSWEIICKTGHWATLSGAPFFFYAGKPAVLKHAGHYEGTFGDAPPEIKILENMKHISRFECGNTAVDPAHSQELHSQRRAKKTPGVFVVRSQCCEFLMCTISHETFYPVISRPEPTSESMRFY